MEKEEARLIPRIILWIINGLLRYLARKYTTAVEREAIYPANDKTEMIISLMAEYETSPNILTHYRLWDYVIFHYPQTKTGYWVITRPTATTLKIARKEPVVK